MQNESKNKEVTPKTNDEKNEIPDYLKAIDKVLLEVFDGIQNGLSVIDTDFNILGANKWFREIFSDSAPLVGKKCYEVYQQRQEPCPYCPAAATIETGSMQVTIAPLRKNNKDKGLLELTTLPYKDEQGAVRGVIAHVKNITDQFEAEEKFRALAYAMELLADGVAALNTEGELRYSNQSFAEQLGCSKAELIGKQFTDFMTDRQKDQFLQDMEKIRQGNVVSSVEYTGKKSDGTLINWSLSLSGTNNDNGYPSTIIVAARDLSRQKKTEAALEKQEKKYRFLIENSPLGILSTDTDGNLVDANRMALNILGLRSASAARSVNVLKFPPLVGAGIAGDIEECIRSGKPDIHERRYTSLKGKQMVLMYHTTPILNQDGSILGVQGIMEDITERKRLQKHLYQAQKMEAVGTLAGGIAHDFNNLLMGIQGRTSLMLMDIDKDHEHYEHVKGIETCIKSAVSLTGQLLGFARRGKYEVRAADMNDIVLNASEMFGRTRREIQIVKDLQQNLWNVEVDRGQIEQVILNLYVNARQAMPGGGKIDIETRNITVNEEFSRLYELKPGRFIKISISDEGVGMDEETQQRIFEPFFTTKEMGRGNGLGLASAYGIIRNHGGSIAVHSIKGEGATFDIYLPASDKEIRHKDESDGKIRKGAETVLLIDDEKTVIDVGIKLLQKLGYKALSADNGKYAVEIFKNRHNEIDLVILDLIMPEMNGGTVFRELRTIDEHVKVLLASGYSLEAEAEKLMNDPGVSYIQKPFSLSEFSQKIRQVLDSPLLHSA